MILKLLIFFAGLSVALSINFYRKDYTYNEVFDAFYKLHWSEEGKSFEDAFATCNDEGSQLFYPKDNEEWKFIKLLEKTLPERPNTSEVLVGIRDEVGFGQYLTIDGHTVSSQVNGHRDLLNCVAMDSDSGTLKATSCEVETNPRLFVCKKNDNTPCPTVDSGYKYHEATRKCYKVNPRRKSWRDAMHSCYMEGGLLVVIESQEEANIINSMLPSFSERIQLVHAGFRKIANEFYTLKGKKLEDSYNSWYENNQPISMAPPQPPPYYDYNPEENLGGSPHEFLPPPSFNCGVLLRNSDRDSMYTSSVHCNDPNPFVCEIQARF